MLPNCTPRLWARFWANVAITPSCWLWLASCNRWGYGKAYADGHHIGAHRLAWMLLVGPVPDGLHVLHNCPGGDNPACLNPAHLWLGTNEANIADRHRKGRDARGDRNASRLYPERRPRGERNTSRMHPERLARGERSGAAKLTALQVTTIRARHAAGGISQAALATDYGVSQGLISAIVHRHVWQHLP
jgi:hypothetical protein